jgi:hypothetical protein
MPPNLTVTNQRAKDMSPRFDPSRPAGFKSKKSMKNAEKFGPQPLLNEPASTKYRSFFGVKSPHQIAAFNIDGSAFNTARSSLADNSQIR